MTTLLSLVFAQVQFHLWPCQQLLLASDPLEWLPRCHVTDVHHNKLRQQWSMDNMGTPLTLSFPFLPRTIEFWINPLNFAWVLLASSEHLWESHVQMRFEIDSQPIFSAVSHVYLNHCGLTSNPLPCWSPHHSQQTCFNLTILREGCFREGSLMGYLHQAGRRKPRKNPMEMTSRNHLVYSMCYLKQNNVAWDCIHMWEGPAQQRNNSFVSSIVMHQPGIQSKCLWFMSGDHFARREQKTRQRYLPQCFALAKMPLDFGPWIGPWTQLSYIP